MIEPAELLGYAQTLTTELRFTEVYARRAISESYYALFHRIALDAAALFAGSPAQRAQRAQIARSYDHGAVASASRDIDRSRLKPDSTLDARLAAVAKSFLRLQEGRERADYDLGSTVSWDEAEELFWEALNACLALTEIRTLPETADFLLAPLFQKRGRRG